MREKVLTLIKNKIAVIVIATPLINSPGLEASKGLLEATKDVHSDTKVPAIGIKGALRRGKLVPEVLNVVPKERVKVEINLSMPSEEDTTVWQSPQLILDLVVNEIFFNSSNLESMG